MLQPNQTPLNCQGRRETARAMKNSSISVQNKHQIGSAYYPPCKTLKYLLQIAQHRTTASWSSKNRTSFLFYSHSSTVPPIFFHLRKKKIRVSCQALLQYQRNTKYLFPHPRWEKTPFSNFWTSRTSNKFPEVWILRSHFSIPSQEDWTSLI